MIEIKDKNMDKVYELLASRCKGLSSLKTIKRLLSLGLFSKRKCMAFLVRTLVGELTDMGVRKKIAIRLIAEKLEISEATIRSYVYNKIKD